MDTTDTETIPKTVTAAMQSEEPKNFIFTN